MSKHVNELLRSIIDDFATSKQSQEELEAKALFRLLNYCPPHVLAMEKAHRAAPMITNKAASVGGDPDFDKLR